MDDLDKALIKILQRDARIKFTDIAKELQQPDTTIHFRTRKLREKDVVSRFSAIVKPDSLGYSTAAILRIEIGGHIISEISKDRSLTFAQELAEDEQYLWVAVDKEPMTVYALLMGEDEDDLVKRSEALRKTADVVNVTITPVGRVVKGWEVTGWPQ
jgi:DNA-binding Lrp family transcriptional regulator